MPEHVYRSLACLVFGMVACNAHAQEHYVGDCVISFQDSAPEISTFCGELSRHNVRLNDGRVEIDHLSDGDVRSTLEGQLTQIGVNEIPSAVLEAIAGYRPCETEENCASRTPREELLLPEINHLWYAELWPSDWQSGGLGTLLTDENGELPEGVRPVHVGHAWLVEDQSGHRVFSLGMSFNAEPNLEMLVTELE